MCSQIKINRGQTKNNYSRRDNELYCICGPTHGIRVFPGEKQAAVIYFKDPSFSTKIDVNIHTISMVTMHVMRFTVSCMR